MGSKFSKKGRKNKVEPHVCRRAVTGRTKVMFILLQKKRKEAKRIKISATTADDVTEVRPKEESEQNVDVANEEQLARPKKPDPNPGKTALERLLWKIRLTQYYKSLSKAGYDKKDLRKLEELVNNTSKFDDMCKKIGMRQGHIRKLAHALKDPSYP
ncbi:hypothetical protein AAMO2058_000773100 [Amorphochlora amoebiformis]